MLTPRFRKVALTAHVTSSVGWLGAVTCSLALAGAGMASQNPDVVRGAYVTLEVIGWFVLVPLSFASLLTGVVQALGTRWGVFRHYWVVAKLVMNLVANVVLLLYMQSIGYLADRAADSTLSGQGFRELSDPSPVVHAGAAVLLLLMATTLSVFKPQGLTRYGRRKEIH